MIENAILIAGPTASGKSRAALRMARRVAGTIVNADSMQVYSLPRLLTARPDDTEMALAPHRLYGHVDPAAGYSTGQWLRDVRKLVEAGDFRHSLPIFAGGTGLYFRALLEGLSPMPRIPDAIRRKWRERLASEGAERLHSILSERDRETADRLRPADGQRIVRALEVHDASGRSILSWQEERGRPLVDAASARLLVLAPDRKRLAERIDRRFDAMIAGGALEEVRTLLKLGLDPALPAMKAIGVAEAAGAGVSVLHEGECRSGGCFYNGVRYGTLYSEVEKQRKNGLHKSPHKYP
jgi:tRNA dimethylallyltransferase